MNRIHSEYPQPWRMIMVDAKASVLDRAKADVERTDNAVPLPYRPVVADDSPATIPDLYSTDVDGPHAAWLQQRLRLDCLKLAVEMAVSDSIKMGIPAKPDGCIVTADRLLGYVEDGK